MSSCLTSGRESIFGKFFKPIYSHFLNRKKSDGPVYNFKRKALFFRISLIRVNSSLFLTPVWGKMTSPLKLQYWQPIWNYFESTWITCKSGFFLLISSTVFYSSLWEGIVAEAKTINLGGWLAIISNNFLEALDYVSLQKAVGSSTNRTIFSLSNFPLFTSVFLLFT